MSKRDTKLLLEDMLMSCERIMNYTDSMDFEEFTSDIKTTDATVRNIQILGEAAKQIPQEFQGNHTDIEWTKIIRSRHILVHDYFELDYEIIWKIITTYIPPLVTSLKKLLDKKDKK